MTPRARRSPRRLCGRAPLPTLAGLRLFRHSHTSPHSSIFRRTGSRPPSLQTWGITSPKARATGAPRSEGARWGVRLTRHVVRSELQVSAALCLVRQVPPLAYAKKQVSHSCLQRQPRHSVPCRLLGLATLCSGHEVGRLGLGRWPRVPASLPLPGSGRFSGAPWTLCPQVPREGIRQEPCSA